MSTPLNPKVILAVIAHADDLEFNAGGSIAAWVAEGATVYVMVLTDGSRGTDGPNTTTAQLIIRRQAEQRAGAGILGIKEENIFFAGFKDGRLKDSSKVRRVIVWYIRRFKPDTLVCWNPKYRYCTAPSMSHLNHPDHQAAGAASLAAAYPLARDLLSFPKSAAKYGTHKITTVLMIDPRPKKPKFVVDISAHLDTKVAALLAHTSQMGPESEHTIRLVAAMTGHRFGLTAAEAFVRIDQYF